MYNVFLFIITFLFITLKMYKIKMSSISNTFEGFIFWNKFLLYSDKVQINLT